MSFQIKPNSRHISVSQCYTFLNGMEIYDVIGAGEDCIFLDSSKPESPYSNHSIIGIHPFLSIRYENGVITMDNHRGDVHISEETDIFSLLNEIIKEHSLKNLTGLPFVAGGLGFFGYDLSKELESLPSTAKIDVQIPDCHFVFYDNYVVLDHHLDCVTVTGLGIHETSETSVRKLIDRILNPEFSLQARHTESDVQVQLKVGPFTSPFSQESYMDAVQSMRSYIEEGHIYITNMTHTFKGFYQKDPLVTYRNLRAVNPAPFSAYLPFKDYQILSSSPERFLDIRNGRVETRPIKGTIHEDQQLKKMW